MNLKIEFNCISSYNLTDYICYLTIFDRLTKELFYEPRVYRKPNHQLFIGFSYRYTRYTRAHQALTVALEHLKLRPVTATIGFVFAPSALANW